jgi:hypothetical protein
MIILDILKVVFLGAIASGVGFLVYAKLSEKPELIEEEGPGFDDFELLTKNDVKIIIEENNSNIDLILHNKLDKLVFHLNDDKDGN